MARRDSWHTKRLQEAKREFVGKTFDFLTVLTVKLEQSQNGIALFCICSCSACGKQKKLRLSRFKCQSSRPKSCGCNPFRTSHGHCTHSWQSPTYRSWRAMLNRCYLKTDSNFDRYGGRGIVVCQRWIDDFSTFLSDMKERPSTDYTLERVDNDGPYEPGNCIWATAQEQAFNRRTNVLVEFEGKVMPATLAARNAGINPSTVLSRISSNVHPDHYFDETCRGNRLPRIKDQESREAHEN